METFSALLAICAGNSPVNSQHKGQWRGALMFSLIWVWINGWVNNREAGDLRRYRVHYDVIVMGICIYYFDAFVPAYKHVCVRSVWIYVMRKAWKQSFLHQWPDSMRANTANPIFDGITSDFFSRYNMHMYHWKYICSSHKGSFFKGNGPQVLWGHIRTTINKYEGRWYHDRYRLLIKSQIWSAATRIGISEVFIALVL